MPKLPGSRKQRTLGRVTSKGERFLGARHSGQSWVRFLLGEFDLKSIRELPKLNAEQLSQFDKRMGAEFAQFYSGSPAHEKSAMAMKRLIRSILAKRMKEKDKK